MNQQTEIHTLAGAYALDALTEIERAGFARHVAECETCAVEVAELSETASRLSAAAWEAPPPRLREAVLREVAQTRQITASRHRLDKPSNDVRTWRRATAAAVAAGVIALGGMAAVWVVQEERVGDAQQTAQQLQDGQTRLSQIVAAGDAQVHTATVPGGGTMTVVVSHRLDDGVVLMNNLPAPPAGKVYQLWLIQGSTPTSLKVMAADQRSGTVVVDPVGGADTIGVTIEPVGGSTTPTAPTVADVGIA
jgi:anti-sigma-K factor RskA